MKFFKIYPRDDGSFYPMASKCIPPFDKNHPIDAICSTASNLLNNFFVNAQVNNQEIISS